MSSSSPSTRGTCGSCQDRGIFTDQHRPGGSASAAAHPTSAAGAALDRNAGRAGDQPGLGDAEAQTLRYADWLEGPAYSIGQDGWQRSRLTLGLSLGWRSDSGWSWLTEYEGRYSDGEILNGLRIKLSKAF
jgi:hypothetical protein